MDLVLSFQKTTQNIAGVVSEVLNGTNNVYDFNFGDYRKKTGNQDYLSNLGCEVTMDTNAYNSFFGTEGILNVQRYPRSNIDKAISFFLNPRVLVISGSITGTPKDIAKLLPKLSGLVGDEFEFQIQEQFSQGSNYSIFKSLLFNGVITNFKPTLLGDDFWSFVMTIQMLDPRFQSKTTEIKNKIVATLGFIFPLTFPIVFGGGENVLNIMNDGNTPSYPTVRLKNSGQNWNISNETDPTTANVFTYAQTVMDGQTVEIQSETNQITSGEINLSIYGDNFEALILQKGNNIFNLTASALGDTSQVEFEFYEYFNSL